MTYLATEMLLYLFCAALLGISLGWLIWGRSRNQQIARLHTEMTAAIDAERKAADEVRRELENADAKLKKVLKTEQANSAKAVFEVRQLLETEKKATQEQRAEITQLRADMQEAINAEKASASNAIQEAMREAEAQKAIAGEVKAKETQLRAELEELNLMIGAEKLAAQTARSEKDRIRAEMQNALDIERETGAQTKQALDDIRATLARTFGENGNVAAALDTSSKTVTEATAADPAKADDDDHRDDRMPSPLIDQGKETIEPVIIGQPSAISTVDAEPGLAFDVQDDTDAEDDMAPSADDRDRSEPSNSVETISSLPEVPIKSENEMDWEGLDDADSEDQESADLDMPLPKAPLQLHPRATVEDTPEDDQPVETSSALPRPQSFYSERPNEVDGLQEIEGIDSAMEKLLNSHGCYQFRQLAHFSADDIDWLAKALGDVPDLKERIERDHWITQARELHLKKYTPDNTYQDRPRWWSRRRL